MTGVLDAHVHVWDLAAHPQLRTESLPRPHGSLLVEDLRSVLNAHGVDAAILVRAGDTTSETPDLLVAADTEPVIACVVGWADVTAPDLPAQLDRVPAALGGHRPVGLRHQRQVEPDTRWLARNQVRVGLSQLADRALVFEVVVSPHQLSTVIETVRAVPDTRFVLDHAGKPRVADGDLAAALSRHSATRYSWTQQQLGSVIDDRLDCFGPDRVMTGSDWPVCLLVAEYPAEYATLAGALARLESDAREAMLGGTVRRWHVAEVA